MSRIAIGIDLGTTFSCVAVYRNGNVEIIANEQGSRTTPSYVAFTDQERFVGEAARSQAGTNAKNTIYDAKRLIGRKFDEKSLQEDIRQWPFEVIEDSGKPKVKVEYKNQTRILEPEEISAMILERLKLIAESFLGKPVEDAVITVPAYFNDAQRQATKDAGRIANLNVMRIINEPTAAAIAYGFQNKEDDEPRNILVFDLGGGTFDVTILGIEDGIFEVKATSGDTHLGGEDFDNRMLVHCIEDFQKKHGKDLMTNAKAITRLKTACEKAKRTLSTNQEVSIDIDSLYEGLDFHLTFSRKRFEALNEDIFRRVVEPVQKALEDAKLEPTEIHDVVLVGGSTRIPKIQQILHELLETTKINKDINPDEAVAYGAAVQAAKLAGDESEQLQEMVLLDITPLSLGIEITGGMMSTIIPRNTTIPVSKNKIFTTHKDNQTSVRVQVYEGERPMTKDNNLLGDFRLTGITASRVGQTEINVQLNIDANGILNVTAKEKNGKNEKSLKIKNLAGRLTPEEIAEMIKRAEEFRANDEQERKRVQAKVNLESLCLRFQSEFRSPDAKGKIAGSQREKLFTSIAEVLSWIDINYNCPKEIYERKHQEVHDLCNPVRMQMYDRNKRCEEEDDNDDSSSRYTDMD